MRAAIKFQLRDVETFIHPDHADRRDVRYIKKTMDTWMSREHYAELTEHIRKSACIPMATPFDEASVDFCVELDIPILKLASSDLNDWILIEKIASTRRPVIASTGGSSQKDIDDLVTFFSNRGIPLALNHCVSLYPSEDRDLELNQVDYLVNRYPDTTVGFSTHERHNWEVSIAIAYAKGARTFERHVDIERGRHRRVPVLLAPRTGRHLVQGVQPRQGDVWSDRARANACRPRRRSITSTASCAACTHDTISPPGTSSPRTITSLRSRCSKGN